MPSKKLYLFANWKMYLDAAESRALAVTLAAAAPTLPAEILQVVFPSALGWTNAVESLAGTNIGVGAQNVHWVDRGGYTGEVSAEMYARAGAAYALVGHSERRQLYGETNHHTHQKMEALIAAGVIPVLCVGETQSERDDEQTAAVIETQLRAAFTALAWPKEWPVIVAYEPVWAVGTGLPCQPEQAEEILAQVDTFVAALVPGAPKVLLYGGSVREDNIAAFVRQPHISGVLVGGASVKPESWAALCANAAQAV